MDNKKMNKEKILEWANTAFRSSEDYYKLKKYLNAQKSDRYREGFEDCWDILLQKEHKEIAKRVWWEYEDYVGKLGVGAIPFINWLDKED